MGRRHSKYPQREIAILRFFETFDGHFLCRRPIQAVAGASPAQQTDRFEYSHEVIRVLISLW